ncbi:aminoacyl-tRNA hydrolase [Paludibaculum fermentans]|uniref:Peptidyl-tRNA hydrolase n=1 Tax=Paludibaculum fermentans TaxID=1473598 RepID=A0A7S7NU55_PALFE|nr:aminoacyl-tRNA hydrolase [Paludibaculum fermentans]QOY89771.1 aminoacyl-tRNA hydrolase [Paludibaculum fermentans]
MPDPEILVVGLGNPGPEYEQTPHNLGFLSLDRLAARHSIRLSRLECRAVVGFGTLEGKPALLAKPQTFMNLSGQSVKGLLEKYSLKPDRLILVFDELDLPWTHVRVRPRGSAGGHNGVKDVIRCLGTDEFTRLRLGIRPDHPVSDAARFVLAPFKSAQMKELDELLDAASTAVESIIAQGVDKAMAAYNRRAQGPIREEE